MFLSFDHAEFPPNIQQCLKNCTCQFTCLYLHKTPKIPTTNSNSPTNQNEASFESVHEILHFSAQELSKRLRLGMQDCQWLIQHASELLFDRTNRATTLLDMMSESASKDPSELKAKHASEHASKHNHKHDYKGKLSSGCPNIDAFLKGGVPLGDGIFEIVGPSSAGKTQLCLQLSLMAQLPTEKGGLNGKVLYIACDSPFPFQRYEELAAHCQSRFNTTPFSSDNLYIAHFLDLETLHHIIKYHLPNMVSQRDNTIKLVIIDSIAANFRTEVAGIGEKTEGTELYSVKERSKMLYELACSLKKLAYDNHLAVVVVNQVSDFIGRTSPMDMGGKLRPDSRDASRVSNMYGVGTSSSDSNTIPALGLAWSNMVNTRIIMERSSHWRYTTAVTADGETCQNVVERTMKVGLASHLPTEGVVRYQITSEGVFGFPAAS